MKMTKRRLSATLALILSVSLAGAEPVAIKLANIMPENTPWGRGLNKLSAEWSALSGGKIQLRLYHGTQGNSTSVRQKMNIGTLDAGVFDTTGLALIVPEILTLSTPNLIQNEAEMDAVLAAILPAFEKRLAENGYMVLTWSKAGWVHFFTRRPVTKPDELKAMKLAVSADEERIQRVFKYLGYRIVPTPFPAVVQSLNTGTIDAFYGSPLVLGSLWSTLSRLAPNMVEIPLAPVIGAVLIRKSSWAKLEAAVKDDPELLGKLQESMAAIGREMDREVIKKEEQTIAEFKKYGLVVPPVDAAAKALWRDDFKRALESGTIDSVDPATFEAITAAIEGVRKGRK